VNLRTPITLMALLLVLVGAAWYGWSQVDDPFDNPFAETPDCVSKQINDGGKLTRKQVMVNVYNAGTRNDLASKTLSALTRRGFVRGDAANAPDRLEVGRVTLLDPDPKAAEVRLVRVQFKGKVEIRDKPNLGSAAVDVVVGNGYLGLKKNGPTSVRVSRGEEICVPPRTDPAAAG